MVTRTCERNLVETLLIMLTFAELIQFMTYGVVVVSNVKRKKHKM